MGVFVGLTLPEVVLARHATKARRLAYVVWLQPANPLGGISRLNSD